MVLVNDSFTHAHKMSKQWHIYSAVDLVSSDSSGPSSESPEFEVDWGRGWSFNLWLRAREQWTVNVA